MKDKNTNCHIERSEKYKKPHCHTEGVARSISNKKDISFSTKTQYDKRNSLLHLYFAKNDNVSKKDLRVFLGLWAGIFAVFLIAGIVRHDTIRIWALCGAVISIALLATPRLATPLYKAWIWVGEKIGFVISRVILAIIFFGIFTPLGLIFRLFKRDILGLKLAFHSKDKSQSLFKIRETQPTSMKNQF